MTENRRLIRLVASIAAGVAVLYTALWFWEASLARKQIARYVEGHQAAGVKLSNKHLSINGYPFDLEANFQELHLEGLPRLPTARLDAPVLIARFHPWNPVEWTVATPQGVTVTLPSAAGDVRLGAATTQAEIDRPSSGGGEITFDAKNVTTSGPIGLGKVDHISTHGTLPEKPPEDQAEESLSFAVRVDGVTLPQKLGPLGAVVDHVAFEGAVDGTIPMEPLSTALGAWRDKGGTVELHNVSIGWGKLSVEGEGTFALDKQMQPLAAFSAEVKGWPEMLDALVVQGSMKRSEADFARLGLSLLATSGPDGETELKTPITLQNGQLYLEKAKVAHLPHIDWP